MKKHWGDWNGGENDFELNYGKAMEKSRDCDEEVG